MVLIGTDAGHGSSTRPGDVPRAEYLEIARCTGAVIESYTSGAAARGGWFARLFAQRPWLGAAVHAAGIAGRYDAIYTTGEDLGLPLAALLRLRRWPGRLVCVVHNMTPRKRWLLRAIGAARFHRIVTVTQRQCDDLVTASKVTPERIIVVRNWVDTEFFAPVGGPVRPTYLIACGAENRDYTLLAAAAVLTTHLVKVYGHGFRNAASAGDAPTPANLTFCPRVSFDTLRTEYAGAHGVIVPLHDVDYAAGVTGLVEAMAMGKPVIVTRSAGIADYLAAAAPGIDVEPGDARALADAIDQLSADPARYATTGERNRAWAVAHCSVQAYAERVAAVLIQP